MKLPFNTSRREKKVLAIGAAIAFLIIAYRLAVWYGDVNSQLKELTDAKLMMLEKQMNNLSGMEDLKAGVERLREGSLKHENALLKGDKPPVAAAELQSILKDMASSLQIEVRSERAFASFESGYYLGIPVEIGFLAETGKLKDFLYRLRRSEYAFNITELKVRVTNPNKPVANDVSIVVTGYIRKPADESQADEGRKAAEAGTGQ
ncbi:MAG: hypothetical protein HY809_09815 [Nitrospirae bacterium]|nr:hypothetical protein [Nitrospirota bacterium]